MRASKDCSIPRVAHLLDEAKPALVGLHSLLFDEHEHGIVLARAIEIARSAGVPIGWGSDLMGALEDHQLAGLRLQVDVEGAYETLRSSTSVNAALLRRDDLGRVAVGARGE
jgi:imidazolonepropionase-like amidohydrolase